MRPLAGRPIFHGLLAITFAAAPARAQRVAGAGEDAILIPRGSLRIQIGGRTAQSNERYNAATGDLEPLGVALTRDTLGVIVFPQLLPVQTGIRSLTGISGFTATLGKSLARVNQHAFTIPLSVDYGLSRRIMVGFNIPLVRTTTSVFWSTNPTGTEATVGLNPALTDAAALAQDTSLVNAIMRASAQLNARLAECAGSSTPSCASINADRNAAQSLATTSAAFATGVQQIYTVASFVPISGTTAQQALAARVAAFKSAYQSYGISALATAPAAPVAAPGAISSVDAARLLSEGAYLFSAVPLGTYERLRIGDVELSGKIAILDSFGGDQARRLAPAGFNYRFSVGALVRLPTGGPPRANRFFEAGAGDGQLDVEGSAHTDLLFGRKFWTSATARYTAQAADEQTLRIPDTPDQVILEKFREREVSRDLGDVLEIAINPRYVANDYFSLAAHYQYRRKGEDRYEGKFDVAAGETRGAAIALDASVLNYGTEMTEQRAGFGFALSNMAAFARGQGRFPFEASYMHYRTVSGSRGNVPRLSVDQVRFRVYLRTKPGR